MVKRTYIFFLFFLKIDENNSSLFSKNCSLFYFIFKKSFPNNNGQIVLENFKNKFVFLKIKNCF